MREAERQLQWSREHLDAGLYATALHYLGSAFVELRVAERYVEEKAKAEAAEAADAGTVRGSLGASDADATGIGARARDPARDPTSHD
jgi:hypothetical protein